MNDAQPEKRNGRIETADAMPENVRGTDDLPEDVRAALMSNGRLEVADDTPLASIKRALLLKKARIEMRKKQGRKDNGKKDREPKKTC